MKTAILLLAAGSSSRMGKPKQLLPFKNTTLLGNAIEQAKKSKTNAVYCVLGANTKIIQESISNYKTQTIFNPNFKDGLSTSIVLGVNHLKDKYDAILIMLADQPEVSSNYLNEFINLSNKNPSKIIASNYQNKIGVPAIFPKMYFHQLLKLEGDKGAKEILNNEINIIKMAPINLTDIDTEEDYLNLIN